MQTSLELIGQRAALGPPRVPARAVLFPQLEPAFCEPSYLRDVLRHRFTISGETFDLDAQIDWLSNPSRDIERHIVLHKFYFAPGLAQRFVETGDAAYVDALTALIDSWIAMTPPGFIATDVTARRVQNWLYAWHILERSGYRLPADFEERLRYSVCEQTEHVIEHLAPARNHRTLGLYCIFLASIQLAEMPSARRWRAFALTEMPKNIHSDVLADGVHCELSTDYHHIVLKNYLLFLRTALANGIMVPESIEDPLVRALAFAMHIHRPDGQIPALSDGDSRSYLELLEWGSSLFGRDDFAFVASRGRTGAPPADQHAVFDASGYAVLRSPWAEQSFGDARYLVLDAGPIGAGNHGHLDALSIEVAAYGRSLIVDPGRYTYDESGPINWRSRFRATRAHNTVVVDGLEQVRYEQRAQRKKILLPHPETTLEARLDSPWPTLVGRCVSPNYESVHTRHVLFAESRDWWIGDELVADEPHLYELCFQLAPEALGRVEFVCHEGGLELVAPGLQMLFLGEWDNWGLEESYVSALYGHKQQAPRVVLTRRATSTTMITLIWPFRAQPATIDCSRGAMEIRCSAGDETGRRHWRWIEATRSLHIDDDRTWLLGEGVPC